MTVKELRRLLDDYPDDIQVFTLREHLPYGSGTGIFMDLEVHTVIDQNTNETSLCLCPKIILHSS